MIGPVPGNCEINIGSGKIRNSGTIAHPVDVHMHRDRIDDVGVDGPSLDRHPVQFRHGGGLDISERILRSWTHRSLGDSWFVTIAALGSQITEIRDPGPHH